MRMNDVFLFEFLVILYLKIKKCILLVNDEVSFKVFSVKMIIVMIVIGSLVLCVDIDVCVVLNLL